MMVAAVAFVTVALFTTLVDMNVSIISLALVTLMTMLFSLSFGFIAFSLQAASNITRRMATAVAVFVGFGGYLLASLSGLTDWLKVPAKFAPFHYFNPEAILHGNISLGITIYLIATLIIFSVIGWLGFRRRDIY